MPPETPLTITIETWHVWLSVKIVAAILFLRWERKHNEMGISESIRRFILHAVVNPEWGLVKGIVGLPLCLLLGMPKNRFMPIKFPKPQHHCPVCKDSGIVRESWHQRGRQCTCQISKHWLKELESDRRALRGL